MNRTNRTLSANLNRLNLGTRSLVLATGLNDGLSTLDVRLAHDSGMRDGMHEGFGPPIIESVGFVTLTIPCPFPANPWPGRPRPSRAVRPQVAVPVVTLAEADQAGAVQSQARARLASSKREETRRARPLSESSSVSRRSSGEVLGRRVPGETAYTTAAAKRAAAGG